jgi:hypothetical protein
MVEDWARQGKMALVQLQAQVAQRAKLFMGAMETVLLI